MDYYPKPLTFQISFTIDIDFADMFLIRGFQSGKVGSRTGVEMGTHSMTYDYKGADNVRRSSIVSWDREPIKVKEGYVNFEFNLIHGEEQTLTFKISPVIDGERGTVYSPDVAYKSLLLPINLGMTRRRKLKQITCRYKGWLIAVLVI